MSRFQDCGFDTAMLPRTNHVLYVCTQPMLHTYPWQERGGESLQLELMRHVEDI